MKSNHLTILLGGVLAAATVAVFYPAIHHPFVSFDDPDYVTANPHVTGGLTGADVTWAFRANHSANWHPLTWLSHQLDVTVYGLNPAGHHLTSVLLHAANTVLLFLLLQRMTRDGGPNRSPQSTVHSPPSSRVSRLVSRVTRHPSPVTLWPSFFVAALFALHPLRVESVAWVAERKDVLSGFFFMLTLWAYGRYAQVQSLKSQVSSRESVISNQWPVISGEAPGVTTTDHRLLITDYAPRIPHHALLFYLLALGCFALGLMSKPMLVTLPFVLLLLDYWPLRRIQNAECRMQNGKPGVTHVPFVILEKVPFLVLSLGSCVVTLRVQQAGGAVESLEQLPLGSRLANALASYGAYLWQTVWPRGLSVFYPHVPVPAWQVGASVLLLTCLTTLCLWQARARPWLLVGWAWFCLMLLPVIGLVQVGWQAKADRYTYLPSIGLFIMVVWGVRRPPKGGTPNLRCSGLVAGGLALLVCAAGTRMQLRHWRDSESIFRHALAVTTGNWLAHHNLGTVLAEEGKADEAAEHLRAALQINSACEDARSNLGRLLAEQGKRDEGKAQLEALLRANPRHAGAHRNLGSILFAEGNTAEGLAEYALARQLQPDDSATPEDLAAALAKPGAPRIPLPQLGQALALLPTAELRAQLAGTWAEQGKYQSAIEVYRAALALQPQSPDLLNNLAWLLATCPEAEVRDGAGAVRLAERACELSGGKRTVMVGTLAAAYAEAGRFADAAATAQKACALAVASGDKALAARNEELLVLYRAGRAYHEAARRGTQPQRDRDSHR